MFETLEYVEEKCLELIESEYGEVEDISYNKVVDGFDVNLVLKDTDRQVCLEFKKGKEIQAYLYTYALDPFSDIPQEYNVKLEELITAKVQKLLGVEYAMLAIVSREELLSHD